MMASADGVVIPAGETSHCNVKPVELAGPSIGNHLAMMTAGTAAATKISIALHTAAMTKGKAPATMMMSQLLKEQREAIAVAEIHCRTSRVNGATLHHPHQAALMAAAVAAQPGHAPPGKIRRKKAIQHAYPLKRDCQVSNSLLPQPKVLWTADT
jgi:hypothetical protein